MQRTLNSFFLRKGASSTPPKSNKRSLREAEEQQSDDDDFDSTTKTKQSNNNRRQRRTPNDNGEQQPPTKRTRIAATSVPLPRLQARSSRKTVSYRENDEEDEDATQQFEPESEFFNEEEEEEEEEERKAPTKKGRGTARGGAKKSAPMSMKGASTSSSSSRSSFSVTGVSSVSKVGGNTFTTSSSKNGRTMTLLPKQEEKTKATWEVPKVEERRYYWLEEIRDGNGRSREDPNYDPSSLHIPYSAYNKLTAFEQQYWDVKRKYFDTIVFFKKGKFYELYELDADVGHKEFDLKVTDRVNMRMVGVPESSFNEWAAKFLARGYKITRTEQTETTSDMKKRKTQARGTFTKKEEVIARGVTGILTPGTINDPELLSSRTSTYFLAIKEEYVTSNSSSLGVCFVDTSVGEVRVKPHPFNVIGGCP
jgi:DNA mismatch repair protein MSH6